MKIFVIMFIAVCFSNCSQNQSNAKYIKIVDANGDTLVFFDNSDAGLLNWTQAKSYANSITTNIYKDWELPNLEELQLLYSSKSNIENLDYWSCQAKFIYNNSKASKGSGLRTDAYLYRYYFNFKAGKIESQLYEMETSSSFSNSIKTNVLTHYTVYVHRIKKIGNTETKSYNNDNAISIIEDSLPPQITFQDEAHNASVKKYYVENKSKYSDLNYIRLPNKIIGYCIYNQYESWPKYILTLNNNIWEYWEEVTNLSDYQELFKRDKILGIESQFNNRYFLPSGKYCKNLKEDDNYFYLSSEVNYMQNLMQEKDKYTDDIMEESYKDESEDKGVEIFDENNGMTKLLLDAGVNQRCFKIPKNNGPLVIIDYKKKQLSNNSFSDDQDIFAWIYDFHFAKKIKQ